MRMPGMTSPEYFQGLWGDRNTANFDEQRHHHPIIKNKTPAPYSTGKLHSHTPLSDTRIYCQTKQ